MRSYSHCFFAILSSYNRRRELRRLMGWAQRKGLKHPYRLYQFRLQDEDVRLSRFNLQYPRLCWLVQIVHTFNGLLFPPARYPRRGSASGYRRVSR